MKNLEEIKKEAQSRGIEIGYEYGTNDFENEKEFCDIAPGRKEIIYPKDIKTKEEREIYYEEYSKGFSFGYNLGYK